MVRLFVRSLVFVATTAVAGPPASVLAVDTTRFPEVTLRVRWAPPGAPVRVFEDGVEVQPRGSLAQAQGNPPLDLTLLVDVTATMAEELEAFEGQLGMFIQRAPPHTRVQLITFRDRVISVSPSTRRMQRLVKWFDDLEAMGGGGDLAENSLEAVAFALSLPSRPGAKRAFVLLTDGPPHEADEMTTWTAASLAERLADAHVQLDVIGSPHPSYALLARLTHGSVTSRFQVPIETFSDGQLTFRTPNARPDGRPRNVTFVCRHEQHTIEGSATYLAPGVVDASSTHEPSLMKRARDFVSDGRADTMWVVDGPDRAALEVTPRRFASDVVLHFSNELRFGLPSALELSSGSRTKRVQLQTQERCWAEAGASSTESAWVVRVPMDKSWFDPIDRPDSRLGIRVTQLNALARPVAVTEIDFEGDGRCSGLAVELERDCATMRAASMWVQDEAAAIELERRARGFVRLDPEYASELFEESLEEQSDLSARRSVSAELARLADASGRRKEALFFANAAQRYDLMAEILERSGRHREAAGCRELDRSRGRDRERATGVMQSRSTRHR